MTQPITLANTLTSIYRRLTYAATITGLPINTQPLQHAITRAQHLTT